MTVAACLLSRSLLGVKRTWAVASHMSAFDPKRTSRPFGLRHTVAAVPVRTKPEHRPLVNFSGRQHEDQG